MHHTDFLLGLLAEKKLVPTNASRASVVYHDSCYLGRYNGVYDSPREILKRIPGVELVEAEYWTKQRGLCCGAGGAQMFMEEQNKDRVNVKRTLQLARHAARQTIASACPFCMTMLTDGLKSKSLEDRDQAARRRRAPRARLRRAGREARGADAAARARAGAAGRSDGGVDEKKTDRRKTG